MKIVKKTKRLVTALLSSRRNYFLAHLLASTFLALLFVNFGSDAFAQGTGWSLSKYGEFGLPGKETTVVGIITNLLNWLLLIFGFLGIIGFVISGIMYLVSAGDEDTQKQAKRAMYYSITGIIVGLVGYIVLKQVDTLLNAKSEGGGGAEPPPGPSSTPDPEPPRLPA